MPVSTECAAALLSFRYPSIHSSVYSHLSLAAQFASYVKFPLWNKLIDVPGVARG